MLAKTSYVDVPTAITYFNGRINTDAWDNASPVYQMKVLIQATTDIDKLAYIGHKIDYQGEHEFPREFEDPIIDDTPYDTDMIPLGIKYAVCEQALALLDGFDVTQEIDGLSLVGQSYSSVKADFDRDDIPMHLKCGLCVQAWQFILPFIRDNRALILSRVG